MPNLLGNVAAAKRRPVQSVYNHSNIQPVYDVYANVQDRDLGSAARAIESVVHEMQGQLEARQPHRRPRPDREHELTPSPI